MDHQSKVIKSDGYHWPEVEKKEYKTDTNNFKNIHRYSLLGDEYTDLNFQTRYFEIQPDGYSSLEYHKHPHSVIILRGSGSVVLGNEIISLKPNDVVYISPRTIHQFYADNNEDLGFICIVDRFRDRPVIPDERIINEQIHSQKILNKIQK